MLYAAEERVILRHVADRSARLTLEPIDRLSGFAATGPFMCSMVPCGSRNHIKGMASLCLPGGAPHATEMRMRVLRLGSAIKAGLVLAATLALVACGSGGNSPTQVKVTLNDYEITSSTTTFQTGVPYHFVITNDGAVEHEFEVMPPDSSQLTQEQVDSMRLAGIDSITPGQTATLDYTFSTAAPEGTLEFACHLPGHYDAGMHTSIVVK